MRDAAFACIRRVGVETGGSNVQFAVDPTDGRQVVIEMNPRVSRSSALASKATGFPSPRSPPSWRSATGSTRSPTTSPGSTPASFEPTIDYVVTKIPRWAFEKLPGATDGLGTRMQSVGEVMAIGRTFPESLQKALRSLEQGRPGSTPIRPRPISTPLTDRRAGGRRGHRHPRAAVPARGGCCAGACRSTGWPRPPASTRGSSARWLDHRRPGWPWTCRSTLGVTVDDLDRRDWRRLKRLGFSDAQLAYLFGGGVECGRRAPDPARPRRRGHLQDRRHLRGRVRGPHPLPLLHLPRTRTRSRRRPAPR